MRKVIILFSFILVAFGIKAQTVNFTQDFSSSTNLSSYMASSPSQNQFNTLQTNAAATSTISIVNGKLRVVKNNGGAGRPLIQRTTNFVNVADTYFMKYSMEVTVSGADADVSNGFRFSLGTFSGSAYTHPGDANTHSFFELNPTATAGEFTLATASGKKSNKFTGTKTIVWYINQSGADAGYKAPDGKTNTVQKDYADIWIVDGTTATLVIDEEPAITAGQVIKNLKVTAPGTFNATVDLDNFLIASEPVIIVPRITAAATVAPISVPINTAFSLIPFPSMVEVTYANGTKEMAAVTFNPVGTYNQFTIGTYPAIGTITPNNGTVNPSGISVATTVTVRGDVTLANAFTPNGDGKNDTWVIEDLKRYTNTTVSVFDKNGRELFRSSDPKIGWDGKNSNGEILSGSYFYIIEIPALSLVKRGVVTVIK